MKILKDNKRVLTIAIMTIIIFARCNLGITYSSITKGVNVIADLLGLVFVLWICDFKLKLLKKSVINLGMLWLVLFSILIYIYGHYRLFDSADMYSRQYTILTVLPIAILLMIMLNTEDKLLDIVSVVGSFIIFSTLITSLLYDDVWKEWVDGTLSESRVGATPAGTCVDTANLLIILLIPIIYKIYVDREWKKYIVPAIVGVFELFASGSKAAIIPLVFIIAIMIIGVSPDRATIRKRLLALVVAIVVCAILVMNVPILYRVMGSRFVELFTTMNDTEYDLHTSTGQRLAVAAAFKEHFWESPILGHGFCAFKEMPYSNLEEYKIDGVVHYRNIQIHNNFMEILFSFGIIGFVLYYIFPMYVLIKSFILKNKKILMIVLSIMVTMLFIDLGLDMYYKYVTPYFAYFMAYTLLKNKDENVLQEEIKQ